MTDDEEVEKVLAAWRPAGPRPELGARLANSIRADRRRRTARHAAVAIGLAVVVTGLTFGVWRANPAVEIGPAVPQSVGQSRDSPVRVGGDVAAPKRTRMVVPAYPANAADGVVILELLVNPVGQVAGVEVIRGVPGATEAAVTAAEGWRFEPLIQGGEPVWCVIAAALPSPWRAD
jgi:TonB family protein